MYGTIFDLDGTLVASEVLYRRATATILKKTGRTLDELTPLENSIIPGRSALENMRFYVSRFDLPWSAEFLVIKRMEIITQLLHDEGVMLIPGAFEFCRTLRDEGFKLAIASSSPRPYVKLVLEVTGLTDFFGVVLSGDDVTRHKPDPEIFTLACEKLNVETSRSVVFEDAHSGLLAARAAGIKTVLVYNDIILPQQRIMADVVIPHYCGLESRDLIKLMNRDVKGLVNCEIERPDEGIT